MKVRALTSFGGTYARGNHVHYGKGDKFELPTGVDWLNAGLVEAIETQPEAAVVKPPRKAVRRKPKRKTVG